MEDQVNLTIWVSNSSNNNDMIDNNNKLYTSRFCNNKIKIPNKLPINPLIMHWNLLLIITWILKIRDNRFSHEICSNRLGPSTMSNLMIKQNLKKMYKTRILQARSYKTIRMVHKLISHNDYFLLTHSPVYRKVPNLHNSILI